MVHRRLRGLDHQSTLLVLAAAFSFVGCGNEPSADLPLSGVSITVTPEQLALSVGEIAVLEATVHDSAGRELGNPEIQWSSSAPEIVAVSADGTVRALKVGTASVGAYAGQIVQFAEVVVQPGFGLPLRRGRLRTEMGSSTPECPGNEGGRKEDGGYDCSHAGISRYSLDFTPAQDHPPGEGEATEVVAVADGTITDVCLQPPPQITCGPNGPYIQVEHEAGFLTIYAHLDPLSVSLRRKTPVVQGQTLGRAGQLGNDTGPWLHFEMRHDNEGANAALVLDAIDLGGRPFNEHTLGRASQ